jgi:hypothetical protein
VRILKARKNALDGETRSDLAIFVPPDSIGDNKKPAVGAHALRSGRSDVPEKILIALANLAYIGKFCELNVHW